MPCSPPRLATWLAATALCLPLSGRAWAEVSESVQYRYYTASPDPGITLTDRLIKASPLRESGQVLLGHTRWQVRWNLKWHRGTAGRCTLDRVQTHLQATVTLPQQDPQDTREGAQFKTLQHALREHQKAHLRLAREAAEEIDRRLWQLPTMPTCGDLNRAADVLGQHLLTQARQRILAYDQRTGQGRRETEILRD
ncbi:MAG: DUF922 domain-containing protein [Burkholderiaceae bacterium]